MRGFFERREREGFAENAKKKIQNKTKMNAFITSRFIKNWIVIFNIFWYFLLFFLSSSAFSAKPSRPLRSKNPRINPYTP
jgi:hypothetical protein